MPITLELPLWMVERIVQILSEHPYTGCEDIIREITEQMKEGRKAPSERVVPYQGGIHMSKMSARQKQGIMATTMDTDGSFYFNGKLDGIWGPESQKAAERFLRDFTGQVEEAPQKPPDSFWDGLEYFDREEFRCQCNGKYCDGFHVEPDETMVRICDEIRRRAGVPILIRDAGGSGLRCPEWNATIPGAAANSYHTKGMAADLHPRGKTPAQLYAIAEVVMAEMIPGRGGLGLYSWGIHVDTGKYSRWNG